MKISKHDIFNLILNSEMLGITLGAKKEDIIKNMGNPIHYEPQKKKNKGILNYGKLNIYIYNNTVLSFSFNDTLQNSSHKLCKMTQSEIIKFLEKIGYYFQIKKSSDPNEFDFIVFKHCQLGFLGDLLCYFWIETDVLEIVNNP